MEGGGREVEERRKGNGFLRGEEGEGVTVMVGQPQGRGESAEEEEGEGGGGERRCCVRRISAMIVR